MSDFGIAQFNMDDLALALLEFSDDVDKHHGRPRLLL